jgi:hypothetical protein
MVSTIQLERTILIGQQFLRLAPLTFPTNTNNDPAFFCADWTKQMILAPPFSWRWNRAGSYTITNPTFTTTIGVPDYKVNLPNFGWIERATAYDVNNANAAYELKVGLDIAAESLNNQPNRITAQYDDDNGNITFRLFPAPDAVYNVVIEGQNAPTLFTSTTDTWAPIPDYLSGLYTTGFQAKVYEYAADPRWVPTMQMFLTQLAQYAENLSQTQKNLWLEDKLNSIRQTQSVVQGRA